MFTSTSASEAATVSTSASSLRQEVSALRAAVMAQNAVISSLSERLAVLESHASPPAAKQEPQHDAKPAAKQEPGATRFTIPGGGGERCDRCGQVVYAAERIVARGAVLHQNCFRCAACDGRLANSPNWEVLQGNFYCGPHFHQRVQRGVTVEREPSAAELQAVIERKLVAAEAAFERESNTALGERTKVT